MRIVLLSSESSLINPLPLIAGLLRKQVKGVEVKEVVCASNLDLANEIASVKGDAVALILFYEEETHDIRLVMEKLLESGSKKKFFKFLEKGFDFEEHRQARRISGLILEGLFGKKSTRVDDRESYSSL